MSKLSIRFLGAAEGVTGSRTLVESANRKYLIDCGLFQGPKDVRQKNWEPLVENLETLNGVIITHAHLDHSGFLPRLMRNGYKGPIYCSKGTAKVMAVLLRDAAYLEEELAHYANKSGYSNHKPATPLFTAKDVERVLEHVKALDRGTWMQLDEHISFAYSNAGHIVGASSVRMNIAFSHRSYGLCFSGDIGNDRLRTMRSPEPPPACDTLILESTYGDRLQPRTDVNLQLAAVLKTTLQRSGVVVIPAFAVGRAQEILVRIAQLEREGKIPIVPVILDSPMATEATQIFLECIEDHNPNFDSSDAQMFPKLYEATRSAEDSMMQCMRDGPLVVISAAGMLTGGRVLHHLKKRLSSPLNAVVFCGYQAEGTKGRYLQDAEHREPTIRIHHEEISIEADIVTLDALSSHGDYQDLISWIKSAAKPPQRIILNHGDPATQHKFAMILRETFAATEVLCSADVEGDIELA